MASESEILNTVYDAGTGTLKTSATTTGASAGQVQGTAASNAAASGNPVLTGAKYNATPQTFDNLDVANNQADVNGNLKVNLATKLDATNDAVTTYPFGHSSTYISTATTTTVKSGAGVLQSIIVNGGTTGTIIAYDNTAASGTIIFSFDTTNAIASYIFNLAFTTGLTIVTSAATKITVTYR